MSQGLVVKGIPVGDLIKSEPEELKLAIIRHTWEFNDEAVAWAVDQVAKQIRDGFPDLAISDNALPSFKVVSRASTDPESKAFQPGDQFPVLLDVLRRSDMVVFGFRSDCGMPDSRVVRLIERLHITVEEKKLKDQGGPDDHRPFFATKPLAVVSVGGPGVCEASGKVALALSHMGFVLAPAGSRGWDDSGGKSIFKDSDFQACLARLGDDMLKLAKSLK